ncbi:MAG TPA: hypothetical protein ENI64_12970 [Gammaproteobacteria bacterium]|nr:hypothetical protein [Gammaproteobacteria bacterium]
MSIADVIPQYLNYPVTAVKQKILSRQTWLLFSWLMLGWYLFQYAAGVPEFWLFALQQDMVYKQITGFILFSYLLSQWRIVLRYRKSRVSAGERLKQHMQQGSIAPLLLYIHSIEMGVAYQFFLSSFFLLHCALGLVHRNVISSGISILRNVWLVFHIVFASLVMVLSLYHIYITYLYS